MSISFQPHGFPVPAGGIAALDAICFFVDAQMPVWSPLIRQLLAMSPPHSHGFSRPHSHMLKEIGRPVALSACDMLHVSVAALVFAG